MKRNNIIHVLWNFGNGGMEKVVANLLKNSSKENDVSLIIINKENDTNALKSLSKKNIKFIKRKRGSRNILKLFRLYFEIMKLKPKIIHIHYYDLIKILKPLQTFLKFKIVLTIHGLNDFDNNILYCDKIVAVSNTHYSIVKNFLKSKNLDISKLSVVYNGIEISKNLNNIAIDLNNLNLVCVGRLNHDQKRQDVIIKYFSRLQKKYPNSKLSFFGSGDSKNLLKELSKKYNVSKNVHFKGSVENESLMKALANFSLMISASKEETFGLNVIESLSIGLPVLAFPAKAIKEIANNNPIVFFFDNEKNFLNSIENEICKISDKEKTKSIIAIQKTFHLNFMINNYKKIYKKLI